MNISDKTKGFITFLICCVMVTLIVSSCSKYRTDSIEKTKQVAMENGLEWRGAWVKPVMVNGAACE